MNRYLVIKHLQIKSVDEDPSGADFNRLYPIGSVIHPIEAEEEKFLFTVVNKNKDLSGEYFSDINIFTYEADHFLELKE